MTKDSTQIIYEPSIDVYKIQFGYIRDKKTRETFFALLKQTIPSSDREYTGPPKFTWMIQTKWYPVVKQLVDAIYGSSVYVYTKEQYEDSVRGAAQSCTIGVDEYRNRFNNIVKELGFETFLKDDTSYSDAAKTYRRLAFYLHPDKNPNGGDYMSRINECWASIKLNYQQKEQTTNAAK